MKKLKDEGKGKSQEAKEIKKDIELDERREACSDYYTGFWSDGPWTAHGEESPRAKAKRK